MMVMVDPNNICMEQVLIVLCHVNQSVDIDFKDKMDLLYRSNFEKSMITMHNSLDDFYSVITDST